MAKIKYSIIIRGNNKAHWLKILLLKLQNQSEKNFEIIYCDNNSEDETENLIKKFNIKKVIKIKKYLPGLAINMGIKKAIGEYIAILSSHCIPQNEHWLRDYKNYMIKNEKVIACYGKQLPLPGTSEKDQLDLNIVFKDEKIISKHDTYLNNANAFYRGNFLRNNLFDKKVSNIEDRLWAIKQSKKGKFIGYTAGSAVFHIDGIHQHKASSERAKNSIKLLDQKYKKMWNRCNFLKPEFYNFSIIINARRATSKNEFIKLKKFLDKKMIKQLSIKTIFVIGRKIKKSNFSFSKKIKVVKPSVNLGVDLKNIYLRNTKTWISTNYIIYLNIKSDWSYKKLHELIYRSCYYTVESITFCKKIFGNFEVIYKDGTIIRSDSLEDRSQKPWLRILKWPEGMVLIPSILKTKLLINKNTQYFDL
tara:strand:- start:777 stop:2033 length:1257 start_codon:yes stop_codon:yes gene_type:complete